MTTMSPQKKRQILENGGPITPAKIEPPRRRNDPSIPTIYDQNWQFYVDLTPAQIAAYQAMPEWATYVATQPVTDWVARQAAIDAATAAKAATLTGVSSRQATVK